MSEPAIPWTLLARRAEEARELAYAPYSRYRVGSAVLAARSPGAEASVFVGANIENASYGLGVCAERHAIAQALFGGAQTLVAIAVATEGPVAGSPCGACRQVLAEFADDLPIALVVAGKVQRHTTLGALLPDAFRAERLPRTRKR